MQHCAGVGLALTPDSVQAELTSRPLEGALSGYRAQMCRKHNPLVPAEQEVKARWDKA